MMEWIKKNDIFSKGAAVAFAIFLWFYVVSSTDTDMSQTFSGVPVTLTGVESLVANNLVLTSGGQSTVAFRVTGKMDRLAMLADDENLTVTADLGNITLPGSYNVRYQVTSAISDVSISKITPSVAVEVDRVTQKSVPVDLTINGSLPDGYVSDAFTITPDAVTVTGPEKLLDTIVEVAAEFDISDVKLSTETTLSYTLVDENGNEVKSNLLSVDTPSVKLSYGVRQIGEIPFVVSVSDYKFINSSVVDINLSPSSIAVSGSPDVISTLNRVDLGTINLEHVIKNEEFELELPVVLPNGVTSDNDISSVKVTVEPKEITKTEIVVTRDLLPESVVFEYASDLTVTVWTTNSNLQTLGPESLEITPVYEAEELVPGANVIQLTVTTSDPLVMVMGDYSIEVEVAE